MNLLPPKQKSALYEAILFRFFSVVFFIFSFWMLIFLAFLYNIVLYFNFQTPTVKDRLAVESATQKASVVDRVEGDIKELNDTLIEIEKIRKKKSFNFPYILRVLGSAVPEGANLRSIVFRDGSVTLSGHAENRSHVLEIKAKLEREPSFNSLVSPLSNIVKEEDINFNFSFSL